MLCDFTSFAYWNLKVVLNLFGTKETLHLIAATRFPGMVLQSTYLQVRMTLLGDAKR